MGKSFHYTVSEKNEFLFAEQAWLMYFNKYLLALKKISSTEHNNMVDKIATHCLRKNNINKHGRT